MKFYILTLLLLSPSTHAGVSDPGGIAAAILLGLSIAFGLWLLLSFGLSKVIARASKLRMIIFAVIGTAPLTFCTFGSYLYDHGLKKLQEENSRLVSRAEAYLTVRCERERIASTFQAVSSLDGVSIDRVDADQTLSLANVPPPAVETSTMRSNQHSYGESYPEKTHKIQYFDQLPFVGRVNAESILRTSSFMFVEYTDRHASLFAMARKPWWEGSGAALVVPSKNEDFSARLSIMQADDLMQQPVRESRARYVLSMRDISSVEDRTNWVARAQIRLTERSSGKVMAEYVGFAANQLPARLPRHSSSWEGSKLCAGAEDRYLKPRDHWDAVGFFFREVVKYESVP